MLNAYSDEDIKINETCNVLIQLKNKCDVKFAFQSTWTRWPIAKLRIDVTNKCTKNKYL